MIFPRSFLLVLAALVACAVTGLAEGNTHFDWRTDTIAFPNDTVFAYGIDEGGHMSMHRREKMPSFKSRCFTLTRAVLQFHQFARFAPEAPKVTDAEYRKLLRAVFRVPTWRAARPAGERIVIPGYRNVNEFSRGKEHLMKEAIGNWLPTYLRFGNWRMISPFPRISRANTYAQLVRGLDRGKLQAVYVSHFPSMNHSVVLFDYHVLDGGRRTRFDTYDPNYPNTLSWVDYDAKEYNFSLEPRSFWPGGRVSLMRVYISPFH